MGLSSWDWRTAARIWCWGSSGAVVNYSVSASDNCDATAGVSCGPASGATFPIGTTTVNCFASDSHGNPASGSFTVTVVDSAPPTVVIASPATGETVGAGT